MIVDYVTIKDENDQVILDDHFGGSYSVGDSGDASGGDSGDASGGDSGDASGEDSGDASGGDSGDASGDASGGDSGGDSGYLTDEQCRVLREQFTIGGCCGRGI